MAATDVRAQAQGSGPILAVLSTPDEASAVLRAAAHLGRALGKSLVVAPIAGQALTPTEALGRLGLSDEAVADAAVQVFSGADAREVLDAAQQLDCALVALGIPPPTAPEQEALFSQVLTAAFCPILAVPPRLEPSWGDAHRVLVPLDGTPGTAAATPLAEAISARLESRLDYVHVAGPPTGESGALAVPAFVDQPQHEWPQWRREFLARFGRPGLSGSRLTIEAGSPGSAILRAAEHQGVDLLVVGWHGCLSGGHAATLRAVLAATRWPVLITRLLSSP